MNRYYYEIYFTSNFQKDENCYPLEDQEGQVIQFQIKTQKKDQPHKLTPNSES